MLLWDGALRISLQSCGIAASGGIGLEALGWRQGATGRIVGSSVGGWELERVSFLISLSFLIS